MKKVGKKAFTLIELIVVIAVVGILVLLVTPRFIGHKDKAELSRIQHDVKVMEQEIGTMLIDNDDEFNNWENNSKDFNQLIQENKLFEKEGIVKEVESIDNTYKIIPERYKGNINTKLKGTFYANKNGKVYYEHGKSIGSTEPGEKEPEYSDEEIQDLIKNDFIPVATAEELNSIRNNEERTYGKGTKWEGPYTGGLDKKYVQVANVDLSEYSEEGWTPIGTSSSFTGTYDGGNYVITGLEVKGEDNENQGLFGSTDGATISNVGLEDIKVTGEKYVGGFVGFAYNSTITNSYATGNVTGNGENVGGLVGFSYSDNAISNSYSTATVTGSGHQVGGLVGFAYSNTTISNSYATGSVEGEDNAGGLVGWANSDSTISNSYTTGPVTGNANVGGLVGWAHSSTINNSYATGLVEGKNDVGGLVGFANSSPISNSYWDTETTGQSNSAGQSGSFGKTTVEMKKADTYSEWDTDVWNIVNGGYPKLR